MVSKNQIKLITSLQQKKYRKEHNLFFVEGKKVIGEFLNSDFVLKQLFVTDKSFNDIPTNLRIEISESDLKKISALTSPDNSLAIFEIKKPKEIKNDSLIVALDQINDPGNLGTIIRLCDWFGIKEIVCSENTVDCYNPKVLQATMGSLTRVNLSYTNLNEYLKTTNLPIYGTFMNGENIYQSELPKNAIIVMGNEANGISTEIEKHITQRITIPRFGDLQQTESLNVATATAITLSEFKRNTL